MFARHVDCQVINRTPEWAGIRFLEIRTVSIALTMVALCFSSGLISKARGQNLTFAQGVEAAWAVDPGRTELNTNYRSASARAEAAGSWFAGGPTVSGQYFDDHALGSNEGYTTYEGSVSVPLWLPGQGSATVKAAKAEALTVQQRLHVERMAVAMRVMDASAGVLMARRRLGIAHALRATLEKIKLSVLYSSRHGETTLTDEQVVSAELANASSEYSLAAEQVETAASALRIVLGRPGVPDILSYDDPAAARARLTPASLLEDNDPRVRTARQAVRAAEEGMRLARASFMPNPEVGVAAIHEKQYGSPWDDRVGVTVSVPLPSDVRDVPMEADARNKLAAATNQEQQARRSVRQELAQVFARLTAAKDTFRNSVSSADDMNSRANEMARSWQAGETSLIELLRARAAAYSALQTRNQAEIAWHVAVIRTLIAAGEFQ
ncbi:TolC family protein [Acetobacter musti]|uniref:TolC family protein n=1 Tax=Acetobacter musti TaxID=864732 RepID=A0ABX0JUK0_9PROT|nr:TolC family protein [Acetobacter musti]NHN86443.1 TolC family protein [Acetobacter musti]